MDFEEVKRRIDALMIRRTFRRVRKLKQKIPGMSEDEAVETAFFVEYRQLAYVGCHAVSLGVSGMAATLCRRLRRMWQNGGRR